MPQKEGKKAIVYLHHVLVNTRQSVSGTFTNNYLHANNMQQTKTPSEMSCHCRVWL